MVIPADGEPMTLGLGDSAFAHSHQRFIQRGVHGSCNWSGRTRAASAQRPQRCDHVVVGLRAHLLRWREEARVCCARMTSSVSSFRHGLKRQSYMES